MPKNRQFDVMTEAERLRLMIEATQAGSWEWNYQTGEVNFNERWAEMLGYRLEELQPLSIKTWQNLAKEEDLERSNLILQEHFAGKRDYYECRIRVRHKSGDWVWVRDYGKLITRTANGEPEWVVGTHIDVTPMVELQHKFEAFSALLPGVVYQFQMDAAGKSWFPFATEGLNTIYGVRPEQVRADANAVFERVHVSDLEHVSRSIEESRRYMMDWVCEYRVVDNGLERWVFGHAKPSKLPDGSTLWTGMIIDITERKELEIELEKSRYNLTQAQKIARFGHWEANIESGTLYWSDMVYELLGLNPNEINPSIEVFRSLVHPDDHILVEQSEEQAEETGFHDIEHRMLHTSGEYIWVHELAEFKADGKTLIGTVRDITKEKELKSKLMRQSITDFLTGAYNRRYFEQRLKEEFQRSQRHRRMLSLVTLDLDHFKQINDQYGHAMGDKVLQQVAETVQQRVRDSDVFARIGGEEFALILPDTSEPKAIELAEVLRQLISSVVVKKEKRRIKITATFGVASFNVSMQNAEKLLSNADEALYRGKARDRNRVSIYQDTK